MHLVDDNSNNLVCLLLKQTQLVAVLLFFYGRVLGVLRATLRHSTPNFNLRVNVPPPNANREHVG